MISRRWRLPPCRFRAVSYAESIREAQLKILIAEDDPVSRHVIGRQLTKWGHEVIATMDGREGLAAMQRPAAPRLAILDWMMPGLDGLELCRRIRERTGKPYVYIVMLTAKKREEDIVAAFEAGADDFLSKPAQPGELRGRIQAGARVIQLQVDLTQRVRELENAVAQVRTLQGLLPMCSYCKRVRNDKDYWEQVEVYISQRTDLQFSHGFCPDCYQKHVKPQLEGARAASKPR